MHGCATERTGKSLTVSYFMCDKAKQAGARATTCANNTRTSYRFNGGERILTQPRARGRTLRVTAAAAALRCTLLKLHANRLQRSGVRRVMKQLDQQGHACARKGHTTHTYSSSDARVCIRISTGATYFKGARARKGGSARLQESTCAHDNGGTHQASQHVM